MDQLLLSWEVLPPKARHRSKGRHHERYSPDSSELNDSVDSSLSSTGSSAACRSTRYHHRADKPKGHRVTSIDCQRDREDIPGAVALQEPILHPPLCPGIQGCCVAIVCHGGNGRCYLPTFWGLCGSQSPRARLASFSAMQHLSAPAAG